MRSRFVQVGELTAEEYADIYADLEKDALERLVADGFAPDRIVFERSADLRYKGQWFELNIRMPAAHEVDLVRSILIFARRTRSAIRST